MYFFEFEKIEKNEYLMSIDNSIFIIENFFITMDKKIDEFDKQLSKSLIELFNPETVSTDNDLIILSSAVKNTDPLLFDDMVKYLQKSKLSPSVEHVKKVWDQKLMKKFDVSTLKYWAWCDNKIKYLSLVVDIFMKNMQISDFHHIKLTMKTLINFTYNHIIKTTIIGGKYKTYVFVKNKWHYTPDRTVIDPDDLKRQITHIQITLTDLIIKSEDNCEELKICYECIQKLYDKIDNLSFMHDILRGINIDDAFLLDSDESIISYANGVYDISLNSFRKSTPNDLIYLSNPIDYEDIIVKDLLERANEFQNDENKQF